MLAGGTVAVAAVGFAVVLAGTGRQLGGGPGRRPARLPRLQPARRPGSTWATAAPTCWAPPLAVLLASALGAPPCPTPVGVAAFALVALPAAEVAFAVVRRLRGRRSVLAGDRGHPYDRLVARGWARPSASAAYIAAQGVLTVGAVLAYRRSSMTLAVAVDVAGGVALRRGRRHWSAPCPPTRRSPRDPRVPVPARGGRRGAPHAARRRSTRTGSPRSGPTSTPSRRSSPPGWGRPTPSPCPAGPPPCTSPCCCSGSAPATRCSSRRSPSWPRPTPSSTSGPRPVFVDCVTRHVDRRPGPGRRRAGPPGVGRAAAGRRGHRRPLRTVVRLRPDPGGLRPPRRARRRGRRRGAGGHLPGPAGRLVRPHGRVLLQRQQDHHHQRRRHAGHGVGRGGGAGALPRHPGPRAVPPLRAHRRRLQLPAVQPAGRARPGPAGRARRAGSPAAGPSTGRYRAALADLPGLAFHARSPPTASPTTG